MDRRIIVNADDFGLCEGVNSAVLHAHTHGVLTSATIMVNMPAAQQAVEIAAQLPNLGLGVHLNLLEGKPISREPAVECLLDSTGCFARSASSLSISAAIRRRIRTAVRIELAAQIEWAIEKGIRPTHLDSHKHIHCFPVLFPIICDLARRFGISAIRWPFEPPDVAKAPWPPVDRKDRTRAFLVRNMAGINRMQNAEFLKTDAFLGLAHTGRIDLSFFRAVASYNGPSTMELMTHPGYPEGLDPAATRLIGRRKSELDVLCSDAAKNYLSQAELTLVHYGQL